MSSPQVHIRARTEEAVAAGGRLPPLAVHRRGEAAPFPSWGWAKKAVGRCRVVCRLSLCLPRLRAGKWKGILTRCILAWCSARRTGKALLFTPCSCVPIKLLLSTLGRCPSLLVAVCCHLFRLDEDGKVLTPEELLYRVSAAGNRAVSWGAAGGHCPSGRCLGVSLSFPDWGKAQMGTIWQPQPL